MVRNDESLEGPRTHPAVVQLEKRLALLQQPSIMDADVVAQRPDAWTALARTLMGQVGRSCLLPAACMTLLLQNWLLQRWPHSYEQCSVPQVT